MAGMLHGQLKQNVTNIKSIRKTASKHDLIFKLNVRKFLKTAAHTKKMYATTLKKNYKIKYYR